jgi:hypothetical protein
LQLRNHVLKTLIERRDKIGRKWFGRVTPIDDFHVRGDKLVFTDIAVDSGLAEINRRKYFYTAWQEDRAGKKIIINERSESKDRSVSIVTDSGDMEHPFMTVHIDIEDNGDSVGRGVDVHLYCSDHKSCLVTGLDR